MREREREKNLLEGMHQFYSFHFSTKELKCSAALQLEKLCLSTGLQALIKHIEFSEQYGENEKKTWQQREREIGKSGENFRL